MPTIKLGVAGTHSTGKTTFLSELESRLAERGLRTSRVGDLATAARAAGFPILHNHTFESTLWIMTRGITAELEASQQADVVLVDRPVMDALAYLFAALAHRGVKLPRDRREYLLDLARHHARTYALICKTVLNPNIPLSAGRDQDLNFRKAVANELDGIFSTLSLAHRLIESGSTFINQLADELTGIATVPNDG